MGWQGRSEVVAAVEQAFTVQGIAEQPGVPRLFSTLLDRFYVDVVMKPGISRQ